MSLTLVTPPQVEPVAVGLVREQAVPAAHVYDVIHWHDMIDARLANGLAGHFVETRSALDDRFASRV